MKSYFNELSEAFGNRRDVSVLVQKDNSSGPNHVTVVGLDVINGILPKDKLTAGCAVKITGMDLRIEGEDSGIYIVKEGKEDSNLIIKSLSENNPSTLFFCLPSDVEPGKYYFRLRTRYNHDGGLRKAPVDGVSRVFEVLKNGAVVC
ncbi:MAG: DUF4469 domain-containing protein [Treponema sp.]|nr:DUF4469 domain-containing protein [Treponema sp.]